jgi:PKD repeat protein
MRKEPIVAFLIALSVVASGCLNGDDGGEQDTNKAPAAQIESVTPNPAYAGQTVTFAGSGSDEDGFVVEYQWGSSLDGEISTDQQFSTDTLSVGEHTVYLKVVDDEGKWSSKDDITLRILPENHPPIAIANIDPADGQIRVNETVNFQGNQSSDPDNEPLAYTWDFGDGNSSQGVLVNHTYGAAGAYAARLTVTDPAGLNDSVEIVINVIGHGVEAQFLDDTVEAEQGGQSDFVLVVYNTGSHNDTFDVAVQSNDGGFDISIEAGYESVDVAAGKRLPLLVHVTSPNAGLLYATLRVSSQGDPSTSTSLRLYVDTSIEFGNTSNYGDSVDVWYAGILASDGILFDTNIEEIFTSEYPRWASASEHYNLLPAHNIGCDSAGDPDEDCEGGRQMIPGFDNKLVGMQEGQTLAVRIPAQDAYGTNPESHALGGQDLIFVITLVEIK